MTILISISNMLTISFGTRTDSTTDPLVERALHMAMEFMDLTGAYLCSGSGSRILIPLCRTMVQRD